MRIKTLQALEKLFAWIAEHSEEMRQRCAICPDCGRNRYTGKPCVKFERQETGL